MLAALLAIACAAEKSVPEVRHPFTCIDAWQEVTRGIEYRMHGCDPARRTISLHLVRIDPREATVGAVIEPGSSARAVCTRAGWKFAINANFFDHDLRPLGVVDSNKLLNRPHRVSWQAVFGVTRNGEPRIVPVRRWSEGTDAVAVQAGPRLVVDGRENGVDRSTPDARAGVCIDERKRALFFATPAGTAYDVHQIRSIALELRCRDAMLFDGGPSVQLFVDRAAGRDIAIEGDRNVPVYLVAR